ncbi:plasma membrane localization protein, partial [Dispira parvispora]
MVLNYSHPSQSGKTSPTPDGPPQTQALFKVDRMPIMRRYIKHATLVENCYPYPVPSDAKPKSNELSYLVYYANSKPAKLAKVGVYLERKIQRELYKRKPRMVEVSLEIFNALLDSCRSDLNYFTKPILNSLRAILISETTELMWAVTRTFIKFCQQYNGSTLAIDLHLRSVYQFLIKQFSAYALQGRSDPELTQKFRYAGLRALNAVVVSELIRVADSHKELVVIIPAVLENLKGTWPTDQDKKHLRAEWKQIENLGLHDPEVNSQTNHSLAWITMKAMVEHSNSINARFFITQTVEFIDRVNSSWSPSSPIVHLFTHIMAALQPQYRFILVTELLHQLSQLDVSLPNTEESGGANRPGTISSSVALASAGGEE